MLRARGAQGGASPTGARVSYEANLCSHCGGELGGLHSGVAGRVLLRQPKDEHTREIVPPPQSLACGEGAGEYWDMPGILNSATLTRSRKLDFISSHNYTFTLRWCLTLTGPSSVRWRRRVRNRPVSIVSKRLFEQYQEELAYDGQPIWG